MECSIIDPVPEINWEEILELTKGKSDLTMINAITLYCQQRDIDFKDFISKCDADTIEFLKDDAIKNKHVRLKR